MGDYLLESAAGARALRDGRPGPRPRADGRHRARRRLDVRPGLRQSPPGLRDGRARGLGARALLPGHGPRGGRPGTAAHHRPRDGRPDRRDPGRVDRGDGGRGDARRTGPGATAGGAGRGPRRVLRDRPAGEGGQVGRRAARPRGGRSSSRATAAGSGCSRSADGSVTVTHLAEAAPDASATVRASAEDFTKIVNGELSGADAFISQQLAVDGDLDAAASLMALGVL